MATKKIQQLLKELEIEDAMGDSALVRSEASEHAPGALDTSSNIGDTDTEYSESISDIQPTRNHRLDQVALLDKKVLQLMQESKAAQLSYEQQLKKKELEVAELRQNLAAAVKEVQHRQAELESRAPLYKIRLEELKSNLRDLNISETQYRELKLTAPSSLHILDEVKLAVYESTVQLRQENERLRGSIAACRESAIRAEEETARLRVENSRMAVNLSEKEKDLQLASDSLQARIDRLASELESAVVKAELSKAKGSMFDELKAQADKLQAENQRLLVVEASHKKLEQQAHELQLYAKQKEHTFEMLMMDKAYLSQQVEMLSEQQRKLEAELELREKRLNEVQRSKAELMDKLMHTETSKAKQEEARLQRELGALQASTHADLERIRKDTAEAYEREARLLRELRDQAVEDATRTKLALSQLQDVHEKTLLNHAELHKSLEAQITELQTELKQRAFELSHYKVVLGEKEALQGRAAMQIELLQEKHSAVMDKYRQLEAEHSAGVAKAALAAATAAAAAAGGIPAGTAAVAVINGQERSSQPASAQAKLQVELLLLKRDREQLQKQVQSLEARLQSAHQQLQLASQPHSFLLQELQAARKKLEETEASAAQLQAAFTTKEQEASELSSECDLLKRDLQVLLAQRAQLDAMKAVIMKAVGSGGLGPTAALHQQTIHQQSASQPQLPSAPAQTTTIIGEGW